MKVTQCHWSASGGWEPHAPEGLPGAQLVLVFGSKDALRGGAPLAAVEAVHPDAVVLGCSTAGEICDVQVLDDSLVVTAVRFDHARIVAHRTSLADHVDSEATGSYLGMQLERDDLRHVFVLSDGVRVNGSDLVRGLTHALPDGVTITGGLSGDGDRFEETLVLSGGTAAPDTVAILGIYGADLEIGYASLGGWDPFGPERVVTRSENNVLYEVDGRSALALYKEYLGEHAQGLPATGLLFPLAIRTDLDAKPVVRTILAVDEEEQSLTFAGDVPEGSFARLMKANFDRLVDGAAGAAEASATAITSMQPDLAILISCVGRKMVLKQRVEEEVEAVRGIFGAKTVLTGFYSYGEISPFDTNAKCELHNQTMTITAFAERP
jgi:hypothetical protein